MSWSFQKIGESVVSAVAIIAVVWLMWGWLKRTRAAGALVVRWVITALVVGFMYRTVRPMASGWGLATIGAIVISTACGFLMAIVWVPSIVDFVGKLFGSLYDGGDDEMEAKPFYSIFNTKRTQGKYYEALAEVRRQLARFPADVDGNMLLAELQAENLNDLPGAEVTIDRFCQQPGHTPLNVAYALNKLADWHLSLTKDREAAQRVLEKIIALLPDTEMSQRASQRIAHLGDMDMLLAPHDRRKVVVKKSVENLGLIRDQGKLKLPEPDRGLEAEELVEHLERHPLDSDAREKLAILYAQHYHRLDLAVEQLEQMIHQTNHTPKQAVHWLNLMADLQVREGAEYERVRETLQRIVDQDPDLPAAHNAQRRMAVLKLELKPKQAGPAVQLGSYEQNLGLKRTG